MNKEIRKLMKKHNLSESTMTIHGLEIERIAEDYLQQKIMTNVRIRVHGGKLVESKFEELARPMVKYLCEEYHPHVTVIITPNSAELLEGLKTIGRVEDYIRD